VIARDTGETPSRRPWLKAQKRRFTFERGERLSEYLPNRLMLLYHHNSTSLTALTSPATRPEGTCECLWQDEP
jgi:hypothetical protein